MYNQQLHRIIYSLKLFHRTLTFLLYFNTIGLLILLFKKENFIISLNEFGVKTLFEKYWIINFFYGIPLITAIIGALAWITYNQYKLNDVNEKLRFNGIAFGLLWLLTLSYVAFFSYSFI